MSLEEEIQKKDYNSEFHKAWINLLYTSGALYSRNTRMLKQYDLSLQQFNILRILKSLHPVPTNIKMLTTKMLDKMSNASRLVEKLRKKGLVKRISSGKDRRKVDISITPKGLELLKEASADFDADIALIGETLTREESQYLNVILDKIRKFGIENRQ